LLGLFFDPEDGGDVFLQNIISQKIVFFITTTARTSNMKSTLPAPQSSRVTKAFETFNQQKSGTLIAKTAIHNLTRTEMESYTVTLHVWEGKNAHRTHCYLPLPSTPFPEGLRERIDLKEAREGYTS
jgi:hypothetical protein